MNVLGEIVGDSAGIRRLRQQLEQILTRAATAPRPPPILLRGETGTGKGLVARTMHRAGPRARAPFVDVNCAAIPDTLLEAELFGYERGAFTDARQAKPGLFQLAHRGTLFLDEIGMLSPALQAKLLKVLEDGVVRRLGGTRAEPVDVWIVSATNEDLAEALRARRFREDLYHRLAVLSLELPPLRERGSDVLGLADRFLARACADYGLAPKTFARDARAALAAYGWPGNVRELGNIVERVALLADEPVVTAAMLGLPATRPADDRPGPEPAPARSSRDQMRAHLVEVLTETGGNISQTAVRLGVARNTVLARMARFGLNAATAVSPARSRPDGGPRHDAPATAPTDVSVPRVAPSRAVWEPRRVALLRVDVGVHAAAGSTDTSRALDDMIGKVQIFGGELVELGPGALVAAFGLEAVEDAPVRAALAALAILKGTERAHHVGERRRVKIVVHVAHVLVSHHQDAGIIDLESKRAAWTTIEALADLDELDTIVVSEASAPFLERRFELVSAGAVDGRGVPFRRLTRRERTGFGLGGRPLSRFVGRDGELRLVTDRLASAARGQGEVVGIVGEPGVGKSRFVYELTRLDAAQGWRVLGCGGVSHGSTTPLLPLGDLLRRYFAIEDADEPEVIREKVTEAVSARQDELKSSLTPLLSLLNLPVDDLSWKNLDPPRRRQQIQDAVKRLLLNESRLQPLLLVIEDLHWVDAETRALLDSLVDSVPRARLVLLVTYRPEHQQAWSHKTYYTQVRIDPLPAENARTFLGGLLGEHDTLDPLKRLLIERTDGNPLFLEESVRTLVESQALEGEPGAYRAARAVEVVEVPATVEAILAGRIDRLPPDERRLLQSAAVIGRDVPYALLQAISDQDEGTLREWLSRLQATEFLYETRVIPDLEYTFKHALTHDVAYGSLLGERRRALHARIVGAIQALYSDRLEEHVERLAHHAVRGELWEQAVAYLRQAGLRAMARAANREAIARLEEGLGSLRRLPGTRETTEMTIDIRIDLWTALQPLSDRARMGEHLHEAEMLARTLADQHRLGRIAILLANQCLAVGDYDKAVSFGQEALTIARTQGDRTIEVGATLSLGQTHARRGELRDAATLFARVVMLEGDQRQDRFETPLNLSALSRGYLGEVLSQLGRFDEAIGHAEAAVQIAEAADHPVTLYFALLDMGLVHLRRGHLPRAARVLERNLDLCRTWQIVVGTPFVAAALGTAYALAGRADEALPLVAGAVEEFRRRPSHTRPGLIVLFSGIVCLSAGRTDEAASHVREALALTRRLGARGSEAHALCLAGDVASTGGAEAAPGYYREALALAEELGMRPLVAHCHLGLGKLYRRTGEGEQAQEHLTTATTMYREMDMTFWLEQAEAEPDDLVR